MSTSKRRDERLKTKTPALNPVPSLTRAVTHRYFKSRLSLACVSLFRSSFSKMRMYSSIHSEGLPSHYSTPSTDSTLLTALTPYLSNPPSPVASDDEEFEDLPNFPQRVLRAGSLVSREVFAPPGESLPSQPRTFTQLLDNLEAVAASEWLSLEALLRLIEEAEGIPRPELENTVEVHPEPQRFYRAFLLGSQVVQRYDGVPKSIRKVSLRVPGCPSLNIVILIDIATHLC